MNLFVGVTDQTWYDFLRSQNGIDEVNFWSPSGNTNFQALKPGEIFLFKLHSPQNYIVGGGFFAHSSILPLSLAWEAFGLKNGASSLIQMRELILTYKKDTNPYEDFRIGCILLEQPFFFSEDQWIPVPLDWKPNIVKGKTYQLDNEFGKRLYSQIQSNLQQSRLVKEQREAYGTAQLVRPRLGQGSFRILVTDAYQRQCAITNERTLPALDAAHIMPYAEGENHSVNNGILLRRDLHALFDAGYITITPNYQIEVSHRIKEEFENGRDYYRHHGHPIRLPQKSEMAPSPQFLSWHNDNIYRG
jgi:putative restriction endonuclease